MCVICILKASLLGFLLHTNKACYLITLNGLSFLEMQLKKMHSKILIKIKFDIFVCFLFLKDRETEREWVGAEREGDAQSEAGSRL